MEYIDFFFFPNVELALHFPDNSHFIHIYLYKISNLTFMQIYNKVN